MFELTYDILDDLEARECNAASQICSNSVTNIFENMTPAEWYDAARESGCNVMFTCGFFLDKCQNGIYIIGDFLNDIVYRFFGETLKVQPVYYEGTISDDIDIPDDVQKEEEIDAVDFLGFRLHPRYNQVIFKIAVKLDLEHPKYKTVKKVLNFLASLSSFKIFLSRTIYFVHQNGFTELASDEAIYRTKICKFRPEKDKEELMIISDLNRMFCSPVDSKFSENIVYGGYLMWLVRYFKDTKTLFNCYDFLNKRKK